jgi:hypothetical protein
VLAQLFNPDFKAIMGGMDAILAAVAVAPDSPDPAKQYDARLPCPVAPPSTVRGQWSQ